MNNDIFEIHRKPEPMALPELLSLGWCHTTTPRFGGARPDGQMAFELGYLHRGSIEWWTNSGLEEAGPGSFVIDRPGDWQGGNDAIIHPCERFWIRFSFDTPECLPGLPPATICTLEETFMAVPTRHFPASSQIRWYFERLLAQQRQPDQFAEEVSRALFHLILFSALHDHQRNQRSTYSPVVQQAIRYLDSHFTEEHRIEDVAKMFNLSVGYFHELFMREVGLGPAQYSLRQRIKAAKRELILTNTSITALSMELGFSSSQYFATVFRKVVGITPSAYRQLRDANKARL